MPFVLESGLAFLFGRRIDASVHRIVLMNAQKVALGCLVVGNLVVYAALASAVGVYFFVSGAIRGGDIETIASMAPANTQMFMGARGVAGLWLEFGGMLEPGAPLSESVLEAREELRRDSLRELGLDITDVNTWRSSGFDLTGAWGTGFVGDVSAANPDVLAWFPVADQDATLATIRGVAEHKSQPLAEEVIGGRIVYVVTDAAFTFEQGHLIVAGSERSGRDGRQVLEDYFSRDPSTSLALQPEFQDVRAALGDEWHFLGYVSPEIVATGLAQSGGANAARGFAARGGGYTIHLTDQRARGALVAISDPGGPHEVVGSISGQDRLGDKVPGEALAALRLSIDPSRVWTTLNQDPEVGPQLQRAAQQLNQEWEVDLETDVFGNLDGNISAVALSVPSANDVPVEGILYAGLIDEGRAVQVLDMVAARLSEGGMPVTSDKSSGDSWYLFPPAGLGVTDGHLVLGASANGVESIRAALGSGGPSYLDGLPPDTSAALRNGPPVYVHVAVTRLQTLAAMAASRMGPAAPEDLARSTRLASGVSLSLDQDGDVTRLEGVVYAPPEGFSAAAQSMASP